MFCIPLIQENLMKSISAPTTFARLVQTFFSQRLIEQKNASPQTIASYRDTFRLLFRYMQKSLKVSPDKLTMSHLTADVVAAFLNHIEFDRGNSVRTRNIRFAAIRSFLKYAGLNEPESLPLVQRVLSIPLKRFSKPVLCALSREEMLAVVESCDRSTWSGERDHVLLYFLYNTGSRVSEAVGLRRKDISVNDARSVKITGKGRKHRTIPLWQTTADALRKWLGRTDGLPESPVFPNRNGQALSRSGVEKRLSLTVRRASAICPTLATKRISPHTIRHTTAMHLLQAGVDITVIAMWLGHESIETTHQYIEANLAMKESALSKVENLSLNKTRYRPHPKLLQFLDNL